MEVNSHQDELNAVCEDLDIDFMGMGVLPKWGRDDISLMPKKRYKIMSKYMPICWFFRVRYDVKNLHNSSKL